MGWEVFVNVTSWRSHLRWTWRCPPSSRVVWSIPRYLCARARWNWMLWPGHAYHQTDQNKPFKEHYWPIMCEHILNMLATGAITPRKNPWSNAVILVYKKDGSLHYCIDFCWLNTDKGLSHCLGSKLSNTWLDPVCFLILTSTQDFGKSKWMRSWSNTLHVALETMDSVSSNECLLASAILLPHSSNWCKIA